tara:strand:- start:7486 stop:12600 length:5115 start_codon:yes stop_codon:yes gene_type:complete
MDVRSIASFVKGRMNKSVDERLIIQGEYVDALNVRLGATETTEVGAVENSRGNEALTILRFRNVALSDSALCIGALEDGMNSTIYWFVHDANNTQAPNPPSPVDLIVSYNTITEVVRYHVESTSVLNFNPKYLITGVDLIDNLLFWTDDYNPPRKINIELNYPSVDSTGVDQIEEEDISVIVKPPGFQDAALVSIPVVDTITAPSVVLTLTANQQNYMEDRFLSFAYRYRYINSEYSATSLFTIPAFQPGTFSFSFENFANDSMQNIYNGADITFNTGSERVIEIDLLYKYTSSTTIFKIDSYNKLNLGWGNNQDQTEQFSNGKIYTVLGSDEILRLYDNVPRIAKAQTIMANRLIYGNYIDGYNISLSSSEGEKITPSYTVSRISEPLGIFSIPIPTLTSRLYTINPTASVTTLQSVATFDLDSIKNKLKAGSQIQISFQLQSSGQMNARSLNNTSGTYTTCTATGTPTPECADWTSTLTNGLTDIQCFIDITTDYTGASAVFDFITSPSFQDAIGTIEGVNFEPMATSSDGFSLTDSFNTNINAPTAYTKVISAIDSSTNMQGFKITNPLTITGTTFSLTCLAMESQYTASGVTVSNYEYFTITDADITFIADVEQGSLHSNRDYEVALVYMDEYARASTALVSRYNTVFMPPNSSVLKNKIQATLNSVPPYWAKRWKYVVKPSNAGYETIYTLFFVTATDGTVWCKLEGDNADKVKKGDLLICKVDALGAAVTEIKVEVLQAQAQITDFAGSAALPATQPAGFYMNLNPINFSIDTDLLPTYWNQTKTTKSYETNAVKGRCYVEKLISLWYDEDYTQGGQVGVKKNINIPAGTTVRIQYEVSRLAGSSSGCEAIQYDLDETFTVSQDFDDLYGWWSAAQPNLNAGINSGDLTNGGTVNCIFRPALGAISNVTWFYPQTQCSPANDNAVPPCKNAGGSCPPSGGWTSNFQFARLNPADPTSDLGLAWRPGIKKCSNTAQSRLTITINVGGDLLVFESDPGVANSEMFYDSSASYPIIGGYHAVGNIVAQGTTTNSAVNKLIDSTGSFTAAVTIGDFVYNTSTVPTTTAVVTTINSATQITLNADIFLATTPFGEGYSIVHNSNITDQNQTPTQSSIIELPFINCYTFGNGVESYKIMDRLEGMSMNLGERVMAVSNQEFKEANRFAGLTYSGIFSGPANFNNLNEFNLGLVNYKDLETYFGEIQVLHARRTDVLVLQEDRISYVLAGKNILTDAVGGGIVTSVPEVLGEQVARIEEYGNSFNPESFAAWGSDMFFTDAKRGAVLRLSGSSMQNDQLSVISESGMRSWFRDQFYAQLLTQKLGAFDPYMDEYVLASNDKPIPFPDPPIQCGTLISDALCSNNYSFNSDVGSVIGDVEITFILNSGTGATVSAVWNGVTYNTTPNPIIAAGTYIITVPKTTANPNLISVEIVPNGVIDFEVIVACPEEVEITVIQVVLNAPNDFNESIHAEFYWANGSTISPYSTAAVILNNDPTIASGYIMQAGTRSQGIFPYDGVDLTIQTNKLGTDTFDFSLSEDKLLWLSTNTLYANNTTEITSLMSQSLNQVTVSNPTPNVYRGTELAASIPVGNQYLYLIYDLRTVASQFLCYDASSAQSACCDCVIPCVLWTGSLIGNNPNTVCSQLIDQNYYFTGQAATPSIGDLVYNENACIGSSTKLDAGYYKFNTNQVLEVDINGIVVLINNC